MTTRIIETISLSSEGAPAIALATIASINVIIERLTDLAEQAPTGFSPVELAAARQTILDLLDIMAELRSDADMFLRATVTYAIDSRLLPQRRIADAARIALQTAQIWATKEDG